MGNYAQWQKIDIPHTWNAEDTDDETPGYFRGKCMYRKSVVIPASKSKERVFIYFEGANQETTLWVNGCKAGNHRGGYAGFGFDITEYVKFGQENQLELVVTNAYDKTIAPLSADFTFYDIQFDSSYSISLIYGDITVQLGKDADLEEKMNRVIAILPKIQGKKGILHMESVATESNTFEEELEQEEVTAENWNGGYDEDGNYTGDGEYDEDGNYVGAKPKTALEEAIENWNGGYDEEGDYTGAGEYDESGNYVGPKPTQESLDAASDESGDGSGDESSADDQSSETSEDGESDSSYDDGNSDDSDGYGDYTEDNSDYQGDDSEGY